MTHTAARPALVRRASTTRLTAPKPVAVETTRGAHRPLAAPVGKQSERGSITVWMATSAFAMIVVAGLAVDLGGQVHAQQLARDVAAQAARAGAEQVLAGPAMSGRATLVDSAAAARASQRYLTSAGIQGTATVHGSRAAGQVLTVRTSTDYSTIFLGIIGINRLHVTGTGTARLVRTLDGVER